MRMSADNPGRRPERDQFGFGAYASLLALLCILDTADLPFCIGVFGRYGAGKTSIVNLRLMRATAGPCKMCCV